MDTEKVNIKHSFSRDEQLAFGRDQAQLLGKKDELESQLKSAKTQIQSQIDECSASIRVVSNRLITGYQMRDVECIIMSDRIPGMRHSVRLDTGHVARVRKLAAHERQMSIKDAAPVPYAAIGLFPIDDDAYQGEFDELPVTEEEFEMLRGFSDITFRDMPKGLLGEKVKKGK